MPHARREDDQALALRERDDLLDFAIDTYLAGLAPNTRRAYQSRLFAFLDWREEQLPRPLIADLRYYIVHLQDVLELSPRSIQAHINTIKGMLRTAAALEPSLAAGLPQLELVKAPVVRGEIQGRRLNERQALTLLAAPGQDTRKGLRDTCILGLMLTLGMRRSEICTLTWGHIGEIDGHKVIINLKGKHGRVRTLKLPIWLWRTLMDWGAYSGLDMSDPERKLFVPITKNGRVLVRREGLSADAIYKLVEHYTALAGLPPVKPHDLRRTAAMLARKGGATIEQVQVMLGHASPQTTSRYIGESLDLDDNAVDYNPLKISQRET